MRWYGRTIRQSEGRRRWGDEQGQQSWRHGRCGLICRRLMQGQWVHGRNGDSEGAYERKLELEWGKRVHSPCVEAWGRVGKCVSVSQRTPDSARCQEKFGVISQLQTIAISCSHRSLSYFITTPLLRMSATCTRSGRFAFWLARALLNELRILRRPPLSLMSPSISLVSSEVTWRITM